MKGIIVGFILFLLALTAIEIFGIPYQTTINGSHTGIITAVETSGIIFKTITVYVKTDAMSSQEDAYCLKDKSLLPKFVAYEQSKQKVTVYFNSFFMNGLKNCNGESAIITGVGE